MLSPNYYSIMYWMLNWTLGRYPQIAPRKLLKVLIRNINVKLKNYINIEAQLTTTQR